MGCFTCALKGVSIGCSIRRSFLLLLMTGLLALPGLGQQKNDFAGEYQGLVGPLHVNLHISISPDGSLAASVDSPDQQLYGLQCSDIRINGPALSFSVPNVRGEWMGTMSPDRASLSGIWKQGAPVALNFTRSGGSEPAPAITAPSMPAGPANTSTTAAANPSQHPPCTTMLSMTYWDGSAWKPMIMASHMAADHGVSFKEGLKNPLNPRAGITNIVAFKNPAATLTLESKPSFCISIPPNFDPTVIMIGSVDIKKDHRELETCSGPCASKGRSSDDWMPAKRVQVVEIKRLSDTAVEITPSTGLQAGQYVLGGPPLVSFFDFGVKGDMPAQ